MQPCWSEWPVTAHVFQHFILQHSVNSVSCRKCRDFARTGFDAFFGQESDQAGLLCPETTRGSTRPTLSSPETCADPALMAAEGLPAGGIGVLWVVMDAGCVYQ